MKRFDEMTKIKNPKNNNLSRSLIKSQTIQMTPAKKRSSLARPVRVYDSSSQSKRLITAGYSFYKQQPLQKYQDPHQQLNSLDCIYDDEDQLEDEPGWPIKLRLEQMLELSLPQAKRKRKKRTAMMLIKQQQQQQQQGKHVCKDTERLLKVLSINNVDQDTRYNVKRCSIM